MMRFALAVLTMISATPTRGADPSAILELLEDNGEALLKQLTNPTGDPGEGHVEKTVIFSGQSGVKIIPMQRFEPAISGWKHRITEKPKAGEYRYLRFAWKADGCAGIMLQMHDEKDWFIRYTAGVDRFNWGTKFVADKPPGEWTVVTQDVFKDFGERIITGIALTAFDGRAAYFDHIYLGRTIEDLDRIDATGFRQNPPKEPSVAELERLWRDLGGDNAPLAYQSFWRLAAAPKQAVPFLAGKLVQPQLGPGQEKIRQWIRELDDDQFKVREAASVELAKNLEAAVALLEDAAKNNPSPELLARINRLLEARKSRPSERERIGKAVRLLEYAGTTEARKCLTTLAEGGNAAASAAATALKRLDSSSK